MIFEVHQPFRIRGDFFWGRRAFRKLSAGELLDHYFDNDVNREIFQRASRKCYLPSNKILLDIIDSHKRGKKQVKVSFSLSGVFLEQCEKYGRDVLNSFKQLAETGNVEFLGQTYYHSLSSLYPRGAEFTQQVETHRELVKELLGFRPLVFENTELLYNNNVASRVEELGFEAICTEGTEKILGTRSPNYLYTAKGNSKLKVILRNYKLTDDIGFRFSAKWWSEFPLTADKYAQWLEATPGQYICIFPDYETFGEHHWPETGIHEFLKHLPEEISNRENLAMATPSEILSKHSPTGEIDVPEGTGTVSWADIERTTSSWLGNALQWAYYTGVLNLEDLVKESRNEGLLKLWRCFQISDHLYYMFTGSGGPGQVHSYFSPYKDPMDAFVAAQTAFFDFEEKVRKLTFAANEGFRFYNAEGEEGFTGLTAYSLMGLADKLLKAPSESISFHITRGDFVAWAEHSLRDPALAAKIKRIKTKRVETEKLRKNLHGVVRRHLTLNKENPRIRSK